MNDSMVDRLDDQEPMTITEALEIPQPRAVGSPLPRGNGNPVMVPPSYADLEDRVPLIQPGPVLAPLANGYTNPIIAAAAAAGPMAVPKSEPVPVSIDRAPEQQSSVVAAPAPASSLASSSPATLETAPSPAREPEFQPVSRIAPSAPPARPRAPQPRPSAHPSTLQRAAGVIRQAIPVVQKLLPLLDGNFGTAVSNLLNPAPPTPPPSTAMVAPPPRIDLAPALAPIRENVAELKTMQAELQVAQKELQATNVQLRDQISEQNISLKRVEDHLELVREATDRNTLEQQELMEDLKSMGSRVNLVAAIAIGLLVISLMVNMALFMHIQRVLP